MATRVDGLLAQALPQIANHHSQAWALRESHADPCRCDAHDVRFDLPSGAYNICFNGPGLRSAVERGGASRGENHIIGILVGLLLPAAQAAPTEQQLAFPGAPTSGPPTAARDLCFPYTVVASAGPGAGPHREAETEGNGPGALRTEPIHVQRPDGTVVILEARINQPPGGASGNGPLIPPTGAAATPARPAAPQTVTVTGRIRYLFGLRGSAS